MAADESAAPNPELEDDVPELPTYRLDISLDTLLAALVDKPRRMLDSMPVVEAAADAEPGLPHRLRRISDLASELRQEIQAMNEIDPDVLRRLRDL